MRFVCEPTNVSCVNETTAVAERPAKRARRSGRKPHFRIRRKAVLHLVPKSVKRTATDLADYFDISRATAWRLFIADEKGETTKAIARHAGPESIDAICAKFPGVPQHELFEVSR